MKPKILVVDDDRSICKLLDSMLGMEDYPHRVVSCGADARKAISEEAFDILISDIYLGDASGLELLAVMKEQQPSAEVVIMTAHGSVETAVNAVHHGAFDYISKPFAVDDMLEILSRIEEKRDLDGPRPTEEARTTLLRRLWWEKHGFIHPGERPRSPS